MRHGDEQAQVLEWAYATLTGDQALADALGVPLEAMPDRTYPDVAPGGTPSPWVVYAAGEALDMGGLGPHRRAYTTVPLNVRVVWQTEDPGTPAPAARRLYELLHGVQNVPLADGGTILTVTRTTALSYPEDAGGIQYRHTGGLFVAEVN